MAYELAHALKNPAPQAPISIVGDSEMVAIEQLSDIFSKVADILQQISDPPQQQPVKNSPLYLKKCVQIFMVILHVFIIKIYPNLFSNYYPKYTIWVIYPFLLNLR